MIDRAPGLVHLGTQAEIPDPHLEVAPRRGPADGRDLGQPLAIAAQLLARGGELRFDAGGLRHPLGQHGDPAMFSIDQTHSS